MAIPVTIPTTQAIMLLRVVLAKIDWTLNAGGGALDRLIEARSMLVSQIDALGGKINPLSMAVGLPGDSWISQFVWSLINLDEPGLIALDRNIAAILWPGNWPTGPDNPTGESHTISYMLGQEERAGDKTATAICDVLSVLLGPDHCRRAVSLNG